MDDGFRKREQEEAGGAEDFEGLENRLLPTHALSLTAFFDEDRGERCLHDGDSLELTMERVLDTAALLHWPQTKLTGGVCATSQRQELKRLSEGRLLLVEAMDLRWQDVPADWLVRATATARETGDLPRLSDVDLDVLALALGLDADLVTDDYRLQNTYSHAGGTFTPVVNAASKAVWVWGIALHGLQGRDRSSRGREALKRSSGQRVPSLRFTDGGEAEAGLNHSSSFVFNDSRALIFSLSSSTGIPAGSKPTAFARSMSTWSGVRPPASRSATVLEAS